MSIHPFDNHSTDVEQELARELQAIARQIRQALQNHQQQAHAQAGHEWDRAEVRGERAAYYEAHYDSEASHAAKLNDQSLGTHPHQAVAAAKARGPQQQAKPARTVQRQVHQQHELTH